MVAKEEIGSWFECRSYQCSGNHAPGAAESSSFEVSLPIGQVKLHIVSGQHSQKLLGLRLVYAPARNLQLNIKGIVMACMEDQHPLPLARCLSTFQAHSEDLEVV